MLLDHFRASVFISLSIFLVLIILHRCTCDFSAIVDILFLHLQRVESAAFY
jgi:hypothetical protein